MKPSPLNFRYSPPSSRQAPLKSSTAIRPSFKFLLTGSTRTGRAFQPLVSRWCLICPPDAIVPVIRSARRFARVFAWGRIYRRAHSSDKTNVRRRFHSLARKTSAPTPRFLGCQGGTSSRAPGENNKPLANYFVGLFSPRARARARIPTRLRICPLFFIAKEICERANGEYFRRVERRCDYFPRAVGDTLPYLFGK